MALSTTPFLVQSHRASTVQRLPIYVQTYDSVSPLGQFLAQDRRSLGSNAFSGVEGIRERIARPNALWYSDNNAHASWRTVQEFTLVVIHGSLKRAFTLVSISSKTQTEPLNYPLVLKINKVSKHIHKLIPRSIPYRTNR